MAQSDSGDVTTNDAPANPQSTPTSDVSAIAAALQTEEPAPQQHAIDQALADSKAAEGKDKNGEIFNPAIHAANADGSPRTTNSGRFALKRGKKSGSAQLSTSGAQGTGTAKLNVPPGTAQAVQAATSAAKIAEARAGGKGAASLLLALSVGIGGEEWQPRADPKTGMNEQLMLEGAFGDFFVAQGWADLPPGWALVAVLSMYSLPRFRMPQTRTRLQKFRGWVGSMVGRWKANRNAKRRGLPESDIERADRESREARGRMPA